MDRLWDIVRPLIAKVIPWGMATPLMWAVGITWVLTSASCIYVGRNVSRSNYQSGYRDGYSRCEHVEPAPDDNRRRGPFRWLFTPALEAPDVSIVTHEQYDGEPELMEAPR